MLSRPCSGRRVLFDVAKGLYYLLTLSSAYSKPACPHSPLTCSGRRVLFDVAKGLYYLHQRRIVHLDLKSGEGWLGYSIRWLALPACRAGLTPSLPLVLSRMHIRSSCVCLLVRLCAMLYAAPRRPLLPTCPNQQPTSCCRGTAPPRSATLAWRACWATRNTSPCCLAWAPLRGGEQMKLVVWVISGSV